MNTFEISPFRLEGDTWLILDQTKLPGREEYLRPEIKEDIWHAIRTLQVRGAPAIGIAAAYGLWLSVKDLDGSMEEFAKTLQDAKDYLVTARPTAVNLSWALERMWDVWKNAKLSNVQQSKDLLFAEAKKIYDEDVAACKAMGEYGLSLLKPGMGILTHCNAGALATSKYGTCLAPIHLGQERGYDFHVFSDETRPLLQGARLTCWELQKSGVDVTLLCDNMASAAMKQEKIDAVVVGCDRMAANGDGANKIGTSGVAILAKEYGIPFYMYVPTSTIDLSTKTGAQIPIEERDGDEIHQLWYEHDMAPAGIRTWNPAFDVTDARYITAVITEKGIVRPPYTENLPKVFL